MDKGLLPIAQYAASVDRFSRASTAVAPAGVAGAGRALGLRDRLCGHAARSPRGELARHHHRAVLAGDTGERHRRHGVVSRLLVSAAYRRAAADWSGLARAVAFWRDRLPR